MDKSKSISTLLVVFVVMVALAYTTIFGIGEKKIGSLDDLNLGLDLAGGISMTYEADETNPSNKDMDETVSKIQKRVKAYGVKASVYREDKDKITIQIPNQSNGIDLLTELGQPGVLEFVMGSSTAGSAGQTVLRSDDIVKAKADTISNSQGKQYVVVLTLNEEGKDSFAKITKENSGRTIAIMYDEQQIGNQQISEAVTDGKVVIYGMSGHEEAKNLAEIIQTGPLSVDLVEAYTGTVGATSGGQAVTIGLIAALIVLLIILVVIIVLSRIPGIAAAISLLADVLLMLTLLNFMDVLLTLPAIAAVILSVGLAVEANIIIIVKIRQMIAEGKFVKTAIKECSSNSIKVILDINAVILIAALVLGLKGSEYAKEFAQVLFIGIVVTLFTTLVVTRLVLKALYGYGFRREQLYGEIKEAKGFRLFKKRSICYIISGVIILAGLVAMGIRFAGGDGALKSSVDFGGGTATTVAMEENLELEELEKTLIPLVKKVTGDSDIQIQKLDKYTDEEKYEVVIKTHTLNSDKKKELKEKLVGAESFTAIKTSIHSDKITSIVTREMKNNDWIAAGIALLLILIYIGIRFKDFRLAVGTILVLAQALLIVLAIYAIFRIAVGTGFLACMLTVSGFTLVGVIGIIQQSMGIVSYCYSSLSIADCVFNRFLRRKEENEK